MSRTIELRDINTGQVLGSKKVAESTTAAYRLQAARDLAAKNGIDLRDCYAAETDGKGNGLSQHDLEP